MTDESISLPIPVHRLASMGLPGPLLAALAKYPSAPMEFEFEDDHIFATPLMLAAIKGHAECVKILLPLSDPLAVDLDHFSALMHAALGSHSDCVEILLSASNPAQASTHGRNALMVAASRAAHGSLECCEILLPASDPLAVNFDGRTALMMAAEHGNVEVASLLAPVSNVRHASRSGETALMEASAGNSLKIVEILAPLSDCFAIDIHGSDAIARAAKEGRSQFIPHIIAAAEKTPRLGAALRRSLRLCCEFHSSRGSSAILNSALDLLPRPEAIALFNFAAEISENVEFKSRSSAIALALQEQLDLHGASALGEEPAPRKSMRI